MNRLNKLLVAGILCGIHFSAMAADFDGSKPLICAALETNECGPVDGCVTGNAESVNLPTFLNIDFKGKMITGRENPLNTSGNKPKNAGKKNLIKSREAKIKSIDKLEGVTLLQGSQHGRGWSMVINQATGKMTFSAAGDTISFAIHGACTPL